ncbi:FAD/FMN-containing dehydrogenase [Endobacter medicaginis]|uniref:FAD/FMN-containing dehydrogenase n=3 Tax=Endobacter medicaginis TaxID=1181271 RepID=A0A839UUI5_9PROT|nr:FAD-binding oxidoreductase [Endobacter medicaginis]MBB3173436.1 FAD/FMN-containing dehydrogenase [Endobacter medicaginis]MCX5475529.1 FAD-binding oxidoreductase [Endobacter medicaginis]
MSDFVSLLGDVPLTTDAAIVKRKSRDFYWYSPVLKARLDGLSADVLLTPRDEADLLAIAQAARASGTPLTARGGGTGNYGQAVPLAGGAVVDMSGFDRLLWVRDGVARVQAGMNMLALDRALRENGRELRMFPSTKRTATIGGFICGGSGGIGSVTWGGLRNTGNLLGVRLVSLEDEPRAVELRGAETRVVNHAYGTTGLVSELEIPVAAAVAWQDLALAFPTLAEACAFARRFAMQNGLEKKLVSVADAALVPYFAPLREATPARHAVVLLMVAPSALAATEELAGDMGGVVVHRAVTAEAEDDPTRVPLYELTWNHTTLQVLKKDRAHTYLQTGFPVRDTLALVARMADLLGDEMMTHLEFIPNEGEMSCAGLPVLRYTTPERLAEIIALYESHGIVVANPHVYTIEDGGAHRVVSPQLAADKQRFDPLGLLNPGKMRSFDALKPA